MNSSSIGSGSKSVPQVKTEWAKDVTSSEAPVAAPREESFGSKLNRIAGVVDTGDVQYGPKKDESLSKEAFLKMTMEQIKYQDPMSPVKNEQFTQQMAMLSQLEQQVNMNSTLKSILDSQKNMQIAALQLVGKDVSADTGLIYHDGAKASSIQFNLPSNASDLKVEVLADDGTPIDVIDVGAREAGVVLAKWDGLTANDIPVGAGKFAYRIVGKDAEGKALDVATKIEGRVTGVTTIKGATFLLVGEQKVALNDVQSIHESKIDGLASLNARKTPGTESVIGHVGSEVASQSGVANKEQETSKAQLSAKPKIEVSDEVENSLLQPGSELSSLFPLLYR